METMCNDKPTISVIIPVYNTARQQLTRCLDSIVRQGYQNLEILVIDDCSSNHIDAVVQAYAARDSRIRLLRNPVNGGPGHTRNQGIRHARGQYISFVDSDDELAPQAYEVMLRHMHTAALDILFFSHVEILENGTERNFHHTIDLSDGSTGQLMRYFITTGRINNPWGSLFCADIIHTHSIFFPEDINNGEDTIFNGLYLQHVERYAFIPDALYRYYHYAASISHKPNLALFDYAFRVYDFKKELAIRLFASPAQCSSICATLSDRYSVMLFRYVGAFCRHMDKRTVLAMLKNPAAQDILAQPAQDWKGLVAKFSLRHRLVLVMRLANPLLPG